MTNDSQGEVGRSICLLDSASKGKSGRMIPLNDELREAEVNSFAGPHVISTKRSLATSPQAIVNLFQRWYRHLGFVGCSSHSGRRAVEDIELTALHSYAGQESGNHLVARADLADVPLIDQAIWKIRPVRPRGFRDELIRHEHAATGEPVADGRPAAAGEGRYNLEVPRSDCCRTSAIEYDR
jgi:hypothetical protein